MPLRNTLQSLWGTVNLRLTDGEICLGSAAAVSQGSCLSTEGWTGVYSFHNIQGRVERGGWFVCVCVSANLPLSIFLFTPALLFFKNAMSRKRLESSFIWKMDMPNGFSFLLQGCQDFPFEKGDKATFAALKREASKSIRVEG